MRGECKIALVVGVDTNGSPTLDNGQWRGVAQRGKTVLEYCLLNKVGGPQGGHGVAGRSVSQKRILGGVVLTRHLKESTGACSSSSTLGAPLSISRFKVRHQILPWPSTLLRRAS